MGDSFDGSDRAYLHAVDDNVEEIKRTVEDIKRELREQGERINEIYGILNSRDFTEYESDDDEDDDDGATDEVYQMLRDLHGFFFRGNEDYDEDDEDEFDEEIYEKVRAIHAERRESLEKKYRRLTEYLLNCGRIEISLTFQEIEKIIGFELDDLLKSDRRCWDSLQSDYRGIWAKAGYEVYSAHISRIIEGEGEIQFNLSSWV